MKKEQSLNKCRKIDLEGPTKIEHLKIAKRMSKKCQNMFQKCQSNKC